MRVIIIHDEFAGSERADEPVSGERALELLASDLPFEEIERVWGLMNGLCEACVRGNIQIPESTMSEDCWLPRENDLKTRLCPQHYMDAVKDEQADRAFEESRLAG